MNELMQQAIEAAIPYVVPTVVTVVTGALAWMGKAVFTLLSKKIKESDTKLDDYLAGLAVKWAEDKYGPGKGDEKLDEAIAYLMAHSQGRLSYEQAETLARSAYQSIFGNIGQLKNAPAPLPTPRPN